MRLTLFVTRISWPLCLTIVLAIALLNQWYFKTGYITYGDFHLNGASDVLPGAFHLWTTTGGLGHAESINWWHRAFLGVLFALHLSDALAQRIVWLYFPPPIFIAGLFLLAKTFTRDNTAAGVAALAGFLNVDFLVRVIGGHGTVLMAIALGPWIVLATIQAMRTRHPAWFAAITLSIAVATAYDARWSLPVFVLCVVVVLGVTCANRRQSVAPAIAALGAMLLGLTLPNLPWLFASAVSSGAISPMPTGNLASPVWVHRLSLATLPDALAIWNPTFGSDFDRGAFTIAHLPGWGLLFPALIFLSVAMSRRRSAWLFFVGYVAGAFLYKGDEWPAGSLYLWAFRHVPLFGLYREPLKFGALASLCGCVVLAFGISALRKWPIAKQLAALAASVTIVALAAPAFSKPGARVTRVPGPQYAQIRSILSRDPTFSRVLWMPESSRWAFGTHDHPIVDGSAIGEEDWLPFRYDKNIDSDPTDYVHSFIFPQLLRWDSIGYVVVDCDTESDATFHSESYSCVEILRSLGGRHKLTWLAQDGPLTLFRLAGKTASGLWSATAAVGARGSEAEYNAGARTGVFAGLEPVLSAGKSIEASKFARILLFDGATSVRSHSVQHVERVIGADSVDLGPNVGDAVIDRKGLIPRLKLRSISRAPSTIAYTGTIAGVGLRSPAKLKPLYRGTVLVRTGAGGEASSASGKVGFETPITSVAIFEKPAVRFFSDSAMGGGEYVPLIELHGRSRRESYMLVGPTLTQNKLPRNELDIRDWLFRTIAAKPSYNARLGVNDRFDDLSLTRVRLVQLDGTRFSPQRIAVSIRATAPEDGYRVKTIRSYPASRFSCECIRSQLQQGTQFSFEHLGRRTPGWMRGVVAIYASSGNLTAIISGQDARIIRGFATAGVPFLLRRKEIRAIVPAPDEVVVDLHVASTTSGVLMLRGSKAPNESIEVLLQVPSERGSDWLPVPPSMIEDTSHFVARVDMFAAAGRFGFANVSDVLLLVKHRNPNDRSAIHFRIDGTAVINGTEPSRTAPPSSELQIYSERVTTKLTAGSVAVAAAFAARAGPQVRISTDAGVPSADNSFGDNSGNRWLVFSQRFDPGWELVKADGSSVKATHVSIFGTLNGWYVPGGLHGAYRVFYAPDAAARLGGFTALIAMVVCAVVALTAIPRRGKRRASAGMFPLVDEFDS